MKREEPCGEQLEKCERDLIQFMILFYGEDLYTKHLEDEIYKHWIEWSQERNCNNG